MRHQVKDAGTHRADLKGIDRLPPARPDGEPAISVQGLTVRYPGAERDAVAGISFDVARGEIFGFLGPSGAGKTTTQKVLMGRLRRYDGTAEVLGREVRDWGTGLYERIGVSFELPAHYGKLTALENLRLFAALYPPPKREPDELLDRLGLADAADMRVREFSKGMAMRLNLARALLHEPDVLFLDEPTSGMDPGNARRVMQLIREERDRGRTVFLTTHDMAVADALCNRLAFIVGGELPVVASPRSLKLLHGRRTVVVEAGQGPARSIDELELEGLANNPRLLELVGLGIETIHTQEASLEDIFIELTGEKLDA